MENSSADIVIRGSDGEYIVGGIVPSIDGLEFQGNQEEVDRESGCCCWRLVFLFEGSGLTI